MRTVVIGVASVVVLLVLAAIAVPNLTGSRIASNETSAIASVLIIQAGQATFRKADYYGVGEGVYANERDGNGIVDLYELPDGKRMGLIDRSLAMAITGERPKAGYYVVAAIGGEARTQFAVCAAPASFGKSARNVFYTDESGTVYQIAAEWVYPGICPGDRVPPITRRLTEEQLSTGWIAVGDG